MGRFFIAKIRLKYTFLWLFLLVIDDKIRIYEKGIDSGR
jgi:hypothetical protein